MLEAIETVERLAAAAAADDDDAARRAERREERRGASRARADSCWCVGVAMRDAFIVCVCVFFPFNRTLTWIRFVCLTCTLCASEDAMGAGRRLG